MKPLAQRTPAAWLLGLALMAAPLAAAAQQQDAAPPEDPRLAVLQAETYMTPPPAVMEAVLATAEDELRLTNLDPTGRFFLRSIGDGFPPLERFATPYYNLGQLHIDPSANRDRDLTTRGDVALEIYGRDGRLVTEVEVPEGARVGGASWSPDGSQVAFLAHFADGTHIYVADADDGDSRQLTRTALLAVHVTSFEWSEDGEHIFAVVLPENRGPEPEAGPVPETPQVRLTTPEENGLRIYFDLLESPHEKRLVHYYSTGQLVRIDVGSRSVTRIGAPAMVEDFEVSPDGQYLRVTTMKPELSYIVPTSNAGSVEQLWDLQGNVLATLDETELNESVRAQGGRGGGPGGGDDDDKRALRWRPDGQPGMVFLQREPGNDDEEDDERGDRVMHWLPPFGEGDVEVVYESETPIRSIDFDESGRMLFVTREADDTETLHAVSLDDPSRTEYRIYEDDGEDELSGRPGNLMSENGAVRVSSDGRFVYLSGTERFENPMENAPRPFIDRVEIRTGETERVFRSSPDFYETVSSVLGDDEIIISRESRNTYPNQWLVNLATGQRTQLTSNQDRHPLVTAARRETVLVTRPDGFQSRVSVTLPHDYQEGTALPAMFWFYPREYTDQDDYDEGFRSYNKNDFPGMGARSMDFLTLLGYAVVEPDLPIVGPEGQMNDEYPHDLRTTLSAVIDTLSARGWVDRGRLGLGGHSYGAFGTANAMIHTPFFKAGIAGDGNYNRSLTPAGFQSERRLLWEAQDLYIEMSPFFQVDRLTGALLMYHGMDDHNTGTHPIHADRMYHALEVLGKTASLYKYPFEDHGPATLETNLDLWARWIAWLDLYVKNPGPVRIRTVSQEDGSR